MLAGLISASAWFAVFVVAQIVAVPLFRVVHRTRLILRLFAFALAGHVVTILAIRAGMPSAPPDGFNALLATGCGLFLMPCLFILYMPFLYTLMTSLSVQTLIMLEAAPGGALPLAVVRERFTSLAFIRDRLETMQANGYLTRSSDGSWAITAHGSRVALALLAVKRVLRLGHGG